MKKIFKNIKLNGDTFFRWLINSSVIVLALLIVGIFVSLLVYSYPTIAEFGFKFISGKTWDPVASEFGAYPFLIGTLLTSFIALIVSFPISITISILLSEYLQSGLIYNYFKSSVELLAGIPSIIYGFWGLFIFVPLMREAQIFFEVPPYGVGILTSSFILSIMIIPYSASIANEVISMTPSDIKEAAYSLGATHFEVIRKVVIPYSSSGIVAGILLSLGRALGETMAVTMVIGNSHILPDNIFSPGNTMASVIANEFTEATSDIYLSALIEIGLLLMVVTALINVIGKYIIKKFSVSVA
ncbi:MAG: phosphate ABC transporter permease subunit PstC [bacterium]